MKANLSILMIGGVLTLIGCGTPATDRGGHNTDSANSVNSAHSVDHGSHSMESSPHAEHADFDLQFLDTMVVHHQGAVDMAKGCGENAAKAEIKKLCADIISSQTKEIEQMRSWRERWFAGKEPAVNMQLAGMTDSMKGMDMKKLGSLSGIEFDLEFIRQMIPHHEGAVSMSNEALKNSKRQEIQNLAQAIIKAQETEIKQMKEWQGSWSK